MDTWPIAPVPTSPDFPGGAPAAGAPTSRTGTSLPPFEIASGIIDVPPSPSELRAAVATMADEVSWILRRQAGPITVEDRLWASGLRV
ncbi:hypothetical protein FBZ90_101368 [Nitrospirillum pindoramense]|uniref:Uncharacterized protein n=1 Tax=Nitrospirillum amazonense TaxID=28077 RepID=A0A560HHV2_9PROT|nr:hypothetical protein FBZ90_101368 [Nitrospirillum amazonense]